MEFVSLTLYKQATVPHLLIVVSYTLLKLYIFYNFYASICSSCSAYIAGSYDHFAIVVTQFLTMKYPISRKYSSAEKLAIFATLGS